MATKTYVAAIRSTTDVTVGCWFTVRLVPRDPLEQQVVAIAIVGDTSTWSGLPATANCDAVGKRDRVHWATRIIFFRNSSSHQVPYTVRTASDK
jgi:hypothetical protein